MSKHFTETVTLEIERVVGDTYIWQEIDVTGIITPESKGSRDAYGQANEPDEPESVEIKDVYPWANLTFEEEREAKEKLLAKFHEE